MTRLKYCLVISLLAASGCNDPPPKSELSLKLENSIIPRVVAWGKTRLPTFDFFALEEIRAFDRICYAVEYESYDVILLSAGTIRTFHGSDGTAVPENRIALIGVAGDDAHIGFLPTQSLEIYGRPRCADSARAQLVRRFKPGTSMPRATLEEATF